MGWEVHIQQTGSSGPRSKIQTQRPQYREILNPPPKMGYPRTGGGSKLKISFGDHFPSLSAGMGGLVT